MTFFVIYLPYAWVCSDWKLLMFSSVKVSKLTNLKSYSGNYKTKSNDPKQALCILKVCNIVMVS